MISEGVDLLVRIGDLPPSDLIARTLFQTERVTMASPAYLAKAGVPQHPNDLQSYDLIAFSFDGGPQHWTYLAPDRKVFGAGRLWHHPIAQSWLP
ncbi:MAG: LysR substrate-binding domain-containing protein [Paracoccaceae bacterium]